MDWCSDDVFVLHSFLGNSISKKKEKEFRCVADAGRAGRDAARLWPSYHISLHEISDMKKGENVNGICMKWWRVPFLSAPSGEIQEKFDVRQMHDLMAWPCFFSSTFLIRSLKRDKEIWCIACANPFISASWEDTDMGVPCNVQRINGFLKHTKIQGERDTRKMKWCLTAGIQGEMRWCRTLGIQGKIEMERCRT